MTTGTSCSRKNVVPTTSSDGRLLVSFIKRYGLWLA